MSATGEHHSPPSSLLLGIGVLLAGTMLLIALARSSNVGLLSAQQVEPGAQAAAPREAATLRFIDRADGAVVVERASDSAQVAVLGADGTGFIRGVLRGLARERRMRGIDAQPPFELVRWSDGRLTLKDTATGRLIDLGAFGPTNLDAFAQLLAAASAAR